MRKIPTLFQRDPSDRRYLLPEVHPGCQWVLDGEGAPTRKYDGTCVMFDGVSWWARREVKQGKTPWGVFVPVMTDEATGKAVGWEPIAQSPFAKFLGQAVIAVEEDSPQPVTWKEGTYELVGPKVNGNPERRPVHTLLRHADAEVLGLDIEPLPVPADVAYGLLGPALLHLRDKGVEGIVWHHPDGRMAKLKGRDFAA